MSNNGDVKANKLAGNKSADVAAPLAASAPVEGQPAEPRAVKAHAASPLTSLLAHIAQQAPHKYKTDKTEIPSAAIQGEPPETDYFQKTWERLSTGLRLKQSQLQVPDNAGPLNSNNLIHRALLLMRDQSPEYLQHFLSYVDTLSWMDQLHVGTTTPKLKEAPRAPAKPATKNKAAPRTASPKKAPRKAR